MKRGYKIMHGHLVSLNKFIAVYNYSSSNKICTLGWDNKEYIGKDYCIGIWKLKTRK